MTSNITFKAPPTPTIFPLLNKDEEETVIQSANNRPLANLSGVNIRAYQRLSDSVFFRGRYEKLFPSSFHTNSIFSKMTPYISSCYKIFSILLEENKHAPFTRRFIEKLIPPITLADYHEETIPRLTAIFSSYFQELLFGEPKENFELASFININQFTSTYQIKIANEQFSMTLLCENFDAYINEYIEVNLEKFKSNLPGFKTILDILNADKINHKHDFNMNILTIPLHRDLGSLESIILNLVNRNIDRGIFQLAPYDIVDNSPETQEKRVKIRDRLIHIFQTIVQHTEACIASK